MRKRELIKFLEDENEVLRQKSETEARIFSELSDKNDELMKSVLELSIRKNSVLKDIEQANEKIQRINPENRSCSPPPPRSSRKSKASALTLKAQPVRLRREKAQIEETSIAISEANSEV